MCIVCLWWFSLFLADLHLVLICLVVASGWLLLAIIIISAYPVTSDGSATKYKEQVAYYYTSLLAEVDDSFRHNMYVYTLYLRHEVPEPRIWYKSPTT